MLRFEVSPHYVEEFLFQAPVLVDRPVVQGFASDARFTRVVRMTESAHRLAAGFGVGLCESRWTAPEVRLDTVRIEMARLLEERAHLL